MSAMVTEESLNALRTDMIKYRAKNNVTQEELAKNCGVSNSTIQSVENGWNKPTARTYMRIKMVVSATES